MTTLPAREARTLLLRAGRVDYTLVRRRGRRGVGLKVDATGLTVSAPLTVPVARVEKMVLESESWVLGKLEVWRQRQVPVQRWEDGAALPYLGGELALRLRVARRAVAEISGSELLVAVPSPDEEAIRRAVVAWYRRAALAHLAQRAFLHSRLAGLVPPRVMLSSANSRWGSCNSRREVRLAWRLVKARPALIDYVVCHELAHLRHMNHSREFWAEVARLCPDYRALRDELEATDHLYRSF
ncbi:MAG: M48 family metallopeptidase [Betaproteobacteria bacterium]|nr:M48 family metallopeptidase [Betaproteobacteria bacterium]PWB60921.1 MAG: M48 family peptidase [Betaproteobacteria bacterium]